MKHKAILITMVSVATVCVIAAGVLLFNPSLVTNLVARTSATQSVTEPQTQPPTQAPTKSSITALAIENGKTELKYGETLALKAAVTPQDAENKEIAWESSDENIASVDSSGKVTALSAGSCTITVRSMEEKTVSAELALKVTDERIEEINLLNEYLSSLPVSQKIKAGKKNVTVRLSQCKILDIDGDGHYELLAKYQAGAVTGAEIVRLQDKKPVSVKTFEKLETLLAHSGTSYEEAVCTDKDKNLYIKATEIQNDETRNTRTVTLYRLDRSKLTSVQNLKDVYTYKKNSNVPDKGEFTIDGKQAKEPGYLEALSSLQSAYTEFKDYAQRSLTLISGKYDKILPVADLEEAYLKRLKWTSSQPQVGQVNQNGVFTAKNEGNSTVTAGLSCFISPIASVSVTVRDNSGVLNKYLDSVKEKVVTGDNNTTLALYASKLADVDGDGVKELLLYYTGSRSCRIDVVKQEGDDVKRSTAFQKQTDSDKVCRLELYMDSSTNSLVLCEDYRTSGSKQTVEFRFNKYEDGKYTQESPDYKVVTKSAGDKDPQCYIDGERTEKTAFDSAISHYGKFSDWDLNE